MIIWNLNVDIKLNAPITNEMANDLDVSAVEMAIELELGKGSDSSGTGFGLRDLQYEYETEEAAIEAQEKVKKVLTNHKVSDISRVYVTDWEDEDEDS